MTTEEMEKFCAGSLRTDEVIACSAHLDECLPCRMLCDSTSRRVRCTRPLIFDFSGGRMAARRSPRVRRAGRLRGRGLGEEDGEIIGGHLENCERCGREVADFEAFILAVEPEMSVEFKPDGRCLKVIRGLRRCLRRVFLLSMAV